MLDDSVHNFRVHVIFRCNFTFYRAMHVVQSAVIAIVIRKSSIRPTVCLSVCDVVILWA